MAKINKIKSELLKSAVLVVEQKIALATGKEPPLRIGDYLEKEFDDIWKLLVPMLQKANDNESLSVQNTTEVMNLLAKGKITPEQALKLMEVLQEHKSVCEVEDYANHVKEMLAQNYMPKKKKKKKPSAK